MPFTVYNVNLETHYSDSTYRHLRPGHNYLSIFVSRFVREDRLLHLKILVHPTRIQKDSFNKWAKLWGKNTHISMVLVEAPPHCPAAAAAWPKRLPGRRNHHVCAPSSKWSTRHRAPLGQNGASKAPRIWQKITGWWGDRPLKVNWRTESCSWRVIARSLHIVSLYQPSNGMCII